MSDHLLWSTVHLLTVRLPMFDQVVVAILSGLEAMVSAATSKMICSFEVSKFTKVRSNQATKLLP